MKRQPTVYVGTREATNFVLKHHGWVPLPKRDLFAFAENVDQETEVYAVVSEDKEAPAPVDAVHAKRLGVGEFHFKTLLEKAAQEARECRIRPPYAVTLATRTGLVTYMQAAPKARKVG